MYTVINHIWNNTNSSATVAGLEFPEDAGGGAIAPTIGCLFFPSHTLMFR